ncbi:MAG: hypothetical protein HZA17_14470 [Nitrospirae bacterium]|nr:hypothetical protein [Nitrospirota bacterium]
MGLTEAKKYLKELHKKQENPFLWPDYLTGLPDKSSILKKFEEVYSRLGKYSIAYIRIANIHPYIIKYGPDNHADIIQWAAAILKTVCDTCGNCFVGTLSTHDFIMICETGNMEGHIDEARKIFDRRIKAYYTKEDLRNKTTLSFDRNGTQVKIGMMKLISVIVDRRPNVERKDLIHIMGKACELMEGSENDMLIMEKFK